MWPFADSSGKPVSFALFAVYKCCSEEASNDKGVFRGLFSRALGWNSSVCGSFLKVLE